MSRFPWIYGHKQSGSNITTRGDYIITQYVGPLREFLGFGDSSSEQGTSSTDLSKNWSWVQNATDGAHAFAMSIYYYTIDYKGYPDPIIKQSGSTYYIDYGAVDMNGMSSATINHLLVNPNCTELPCPAGTTNQGTYYNHTAASAGISLGKISSDLPDELAPDSICPKGWMLPTRLEDSNKSFYNLIINSYGGVEASSNRPNADVIVLYPPLSFIRAGYYQNSSTLITNPGLTGYYWGARLHPNGGYGSVLLANSYNIANSALQSKVHLQSGLGNSVRCVSRS